MTPFRRILFPVDFSAATLAMVPYVSEMAQRFGAAVTVLNAFYFAPEYILAPRFDDFGYSQGAEIPYIPVLQELRKQREEHLQEFSRTHFKGLAQTSRIEDGDPATVIESVAKRENTDLIVMPTKGLGRFRRFLLGSVTMKVLHDLACPVLTSAHASDSESARPSRYRSILCAVDLNSEAEIVLKAADFLAQSYGARLCLLHIEPSFHEHGKESSAQYVRDTFDQVVRSGSGDMAADTSVRVLEGATPEGIRRAAIEEGADLIVVGRGHERGNLSRAWSDLYAIIRESPCPVLSV